RNKPWREAEDVGVPSWNDYAIREIMQEDRGPLFLATGAETKLENVATFAYHAAPADQARLGWAVAHLLDSGSAAVPDLDEEVLALARRIAEALQQAQQPVVISGASSGSAEVMDAAAAVAAALGVDEQPGLLALVAPEANSMGLALMGGMDLQAARRALQDGAADTVVIVENDLYRQADASFVDDLLQAARQVIVLDYLETETTARADVVLPAATFAEGDGTLVSYEGRAQRFLQVYKPEDAVQESWRWLQAMNDMTAQGAVSAWRELDDVLEALARAFPAFEPVPEITPPSEFRIVGQKIPRQPHRYSGRTAMRAHINVSEPKPPDDEDTPLHFSMEGYKGQPPAELVPRFWAPGWNSIQALNKFQIEVGGPLRGGRPGRRLIEPDAAQGARREAQIPEAFEARSGEWLALPLHHIYGSDPLSMYTPGVAELAPEPYVALHAEDAAALGAGEGQPLAVQVGERELQLPLRVMSSLPRGVLGLPAGLPQLPYLSLPGWVQVKARIEEES
ncbi:MAG: molybdopterin-dependent oxidoreductase, partial [Chloroflexota bacterium]